MNPQLLQPSDTSVQEAATPVSSPLRLPEAPSISEVENLTHWDIPDSISYEAAPPPVWVSSKDGFIDPTRKPEANGPVSRSEAPDWILVILVLTLGLLAYLRKTNSKRLRQLVNAFASNRFVRQMLREEQAFTNRASVLLTINYWVVGALFISQIFHYSPFIDELAELSWLPRGPVFFFIALGGLASFYLVKVALIYLAGWLFNIPNATEEYLFNFQLFATVQGLVLLPVAISVAYLNWAGPSLMIAVGAFLSLGFLLVRLFKGLYLGISSTNFSWFYIIVYICSLEILPLLAIAKPLITIVC